MLKYLLCRFVNPGRVYRQAPARRHRGELHPADQQQEAGGGQRGGRAERVLRTSDESVREGAQ